MNELDDLWSVQAVVAVVRDQTIEARQYGARQSA
jgi:hypothetical protein